MLIFDKKYAMFALVFIIFLGTIEAKRNDLYSNQCAYNYNSTIRSNMCAEKLMKQKSGDSESLVTSFMNVFDYSFPSNISNQCKNSLIMYFNDLLNLKPWAIEMFDATGKPPSSQLLGTVIDFGSYEDCLKIRAYSDEEDSYLFKGQFCMVNLQHPLFQPSIFKTEHEMDYVEAFGVPPDWVRDFVYQNISRRFGLYLGICTPSHCTEDDLYSIINAFAEPAALNYTLSDCVVENKNETDKWPLTVMIAITIIMSFIVLSVVGTYFDLIDGNQTGKKSQTDECSNREILKNFSVHRNAKAVFSISGKKTSLDCAEGLRVGFCFWVIIGHYTVYPTQWKELRYRNLNYFHEFLVPAVLMIFFNNPFIVVEGFFTLSGFFLTYTLWRKIEQKDGNIGIWEYICDRYWRLTPVHFFIIAVSFILPLISSGPVWKSNWEHENGNCLTNGWKNLFYIHNFDHTLEICLPHTWYIGVTLQCIILFVPLLVFTYRYPKSGLTIFVLIMTGCMVRDYTTALEEGLSFCSYNSLKIVQRFMDFSSTIYLKTFFHVPPYLVGMLTGWIVLKYKKPKLSKVWLVAGWVFSALCIIVSFYAVYLPANDKRIGPLYIATRNTMFSLSISWIIYASSAGYGGVVNTLLSWKAFVPISRISYSLYLVHPLVLCHRDGSLTERFYMDKILHVIEVVPYVLITLIFAFLIHVIVAEPCNRVYDILKKRRSFTKQTIKSTDQKQME